MGHAAVDDVGLLGASAERPQGGLHLGQHAPVDHARLDQPLRVALGERRDQTAVLAVDAGDVGEVDQLLREQGGGHVARDQVRVDIVGLACRPHPDRGDHRDEAVLLEQPDGLGIDRLHLAHQPDVHLGAVGHPVQPLVGPEQARVLAGEPHRAASVEIDETHDLLVDLPDQDHLDDLHRLLVGDAHAAHERGVLAEPLQQGPDLRTTAVDDDRPDADQPQQQDVLGELLLEVRLLHGRAPVLDHEGLALEGTDIGQRLDEQLGTLHQLRDRRHALVHLYNSSTSIRCSGRDPRPSPRRPAARARTPRRSPAPAPPGSGRRRRSPPAAAPSRCTGGGPRCSRPAGSP